MAAYDLAVVGEPRASRRSSWRRGLGGRNRSGGSALGTSAPSVARQGARAQCRRSGARPATSAVSSRGSTGADLASLLGTERPDLADDALSVVGIISPDALLGCRRT